MYNQNWRERDQAYEKYEQKLKQELYPTIRTLAQEYCTENKTGRPPKIKLEMAAFLLLVKEHTNKNSYRQLATSHWVHFLEIPEIYYTTIQKAIKRLSTTLLEITMKLTA